MLIIRRSKLYHTASGITILKQVSGVMIPDAVLYNFDLLMMRTQCSKYVEAFDKLIIKQDFVHQVG